MAVQGEDMEIRSLMRVTSKDWYRQGLDATPWEGRIAHHLGVLARRNIFSVVHNYFNALTAPTPFLNDANSILEMTFYPILAGDDNDSDTRNLSAYC